MKSEIIETVEMNDYERWLACPCGHSFLAGTAKHWRGASPPGKWLNRSVEHSGMADRIECQCQKCLMWIDATTGELNEK